MLNTITMGGRICNDVELKTTNTGTEVCSFTIACERDFKNQNGEKQTDFVDVVTFRNTAVFVSKYFAKGRMAIVNGRLQTRTWEDQNGNKRKAVEILADNVYFGDSKTENQTASTPSYGDVTDFQGDLPF